jgi:hypothetical protein
LTLFVAFGWLAKARGDVVVVFCGVMDAKARIEPEFGFLWLGLHVCFELSIVATVARKSNPQK